MTLYEKHIGNKKECENKFDINFYFLRLMSQQENKCA